MSSIYNNVVKAIVRREQGAQNDDQKFCVGVVPTSLQLGKCPTFVFLTLSTRRLLGLKQNIL